MDFFEKIINKIPEDVAIELLKFGGDFTKMPEDKKEKFTDIIREAVEESDSKAVETYSEHYDTKVQPIEVMQANMTNEELIGFLKGSIIKYVCRCGRKDSPEKEVAKIKRYAEWLCLVVNGERIDPRL